MAGISQPGQKLFGKKSLADKSTTQLYKLTVFPWKFFLKIPKTEISVHLVFPRS